MISVTPDADKLYFLFKNNVALEYAIMHRQGR